VKIGCCLLVVLALLPMAAAEPQKEANGGVSRTTTRWWEKAADSPAYAEVTAWEPRFNDKTLWPLLTGKEDFVKQQWPKGRLYIWAHPGESGRLHPRPTKLDPTDPANWTDGATGKPATELVLDENTDLFLPASQKPYTIGFRTSNAQQKNIREVLRHLTVESGAGFVGGGDGAGRIFYGNVWVKKGGEISAQGSTAFLGDKHVFIRNDNVYGSGSQYFMFNKPDGGSTEILGHITTADEWRLDAGLVIIGPDSVMQPGRTATPYIRPKGTLVLLDGAYWGKACNEWHRMVDMLMDGTIQAGLPERPLTRDATFALSVRNWAKLPLKSGNDKEKYDTRKVSAMFGSGSCIRTIAAANSKAKLNITRFEFGGPYCNKNWVVMVGCYPQGIEVPAKDLSAFADPAFKAMFDSKPFKTLAYFAKGVKIEGPVQFDHFPVGGILCEDVSEAKAWKDVTFGPNNMGKGDEVLQQHAKPSKDGAY
jgi:hypothetical protein